MRALFIISFFVVFILFDNSIGYTDLLPIWKHFAYVFQHAGVLHLLANTISFYFMWGALKRFYNSWTIVLIGYLSAVFMSFFTDYSLPVVGASGMIYAMIGMYSFLIIKNKLVFRATKDLYIYIFSIAAFLVISFIMVNQAGMLHLLCLTSGMALPYILNLQK